MDSKISIHDHINSLMDKEVVGVYSYLVCSSGVYKELNIKSEQSFSGVLQSAMLARLSYSVGDIGSDCDITSTSLDNVYVLSSIVEDILYDGYNQLEEEGINPKKAIGILRIFKFPGKDLVVFSTIKGSDVMEGGYTSDGILCDLVISMPKSADAIIFERNVYILNEKQFIGKFKYLQPDHIFKHAIHKLETKLGVSIPAAASMEGLFGGRLRPKTEKVAFIEEFDANKLAEVADEYGIDFMTDDSGKAVVLDQRDAAIVLDLLLDNYLESSSGRYYKVGSKKEITGDT